MLSNYLKLYTNNNDKGYNIIINKDNIQDPPKNRKRKDLYFVNKLNNLINKIINKKELTEDDIILIENKADGNCFFLVLSQYFNEDEIYQIYYRKLIALYIDSKKHIDKIEFPFIYKSENTILIYEDYYKELITTGNFAGEYEIINTTLKFNINIIIYINKNYVPVDSKFKFSN